MATGEQLKVLGRLLPTNQTERMIHLLERKKGQRRSDVNQFTWSAIVFNLNTYNYQIGVFVLPDSTDL
ncbi:hypothetical protein NECAME_03182 [Necator americanus]|uniref:Uncharacterized protein n=1 Tax=Necator americanus TaxID=51031 RepID=W2T6K0_NECAM|nr:hypothetical protein NECAME_03182 [Necator americanus]ETN77518.1 hypothetical protein NECAME_03182 [Necator americanus]